MKKIQIISLFFIAFIMIPFSSFASTTNEQSGYQTGVDNCTPGGTDLAYLVDITDLPGDDLEGFQGCVDTPNGKVCTP